MMPAGRQSRQAWARGKSAKKRLINLPIVYKMCRIYWCVCERETICMFVSVCVCVCVLACLLVIFNCQANTRLPEFDSSFAHICFYRHTNTQTHIDTHTYTFLSFSIFWYFFFFYLIWFRQKVTVQKLFWRQTLLIRNNAASSNALGIVHNTHKVWVLWSSGWQYEVVNLVEYVCILRQTGDKSVSHYKNKVRMP